MQCLSQILIANPTKDIIFKASEPMIHVPCGRCIACTKNKEAEWVFRLDQEWRDALTAYFITPTYNNYMLPFIENDDSKIIRAKDIKGIDCTNLGEIILTDSLEALPDGIPTGCREDFNQLMEKIRLASKYYKQNHRKIWPLESYADKHGEEKFRDKYPLRYKINLEYSPWTGRPHGHGLLFNLPPEVAKHIQKYWTDSNKIPYGNIQCDILRPGGIEYVSKYISKKEHQKNDDLGRERLFSNCSNGLGDRYIKLNTGFHQANEQTYVRRNGYIQQMPRSIKEKIWTSPEKRLELGEISRAYAESQIEKQEQKLADKGYKNPRHERYERLYAQHEMVQKRTEQNHKL